MSATKVPALKNIPTKLDRELADTLKSMKEAQEIRLGRLGDPLDRAVTLRELVESGLAKRLSERPFDPVKHYWFSTDRLKSSHWRANSSGH